MVAKKTSHTKQLTGIIKEIEKLQYNTKCILNGCYHFWVLTEVFQVLLSPGLIKSRYHTGSSLVLLKQSSATFRLE